MAYTKYSLTPADNNAAPPNGAPEGMLPSAVNDTMRDMMSQIRDVGDGIRGGTYTMTAPVITGGSITGVALSGNTFTSPIITGGSINNTPIGATTANTGAFTTLAASGVATFTAGTVSAPAITTTGDTNTGIFFPAADTIAFTEGGVESMRIDSSGRVGIGTSAPTAKLHISGTTPSLTNGSGQLQVFSTDALAANKGGKISLGGISGEGGSFDPYGFVAIAGLKENATSSNFAGYFTVSTSNSGGSVTERMRIDSSGNVGIGTSSPNSAGVNRALTISGSSNSILELNAGSTRCGYMFATTAATIFSAVQASSIMQFNTVDTERMRIDSSGNLCVGTTAPGTNQSNIFKRTTSALWPLTLDGNNRGLLVVQSASSGIAAYFTTSTSTVAGEISVSGSTTTYTTSSDYRLKENIAPMTGALNKVSQLKPVTYNWKADGSSSQGFIAHELQAVVPDCVTGEKDAVNEDGSIKAQGIDTSFLVATLTAAIQEQQTLIQNLTNRLNALEGK